jgi:hypothetical protein
MPVAVVTVKSAGIFKLAFAPKITPAGLIKNRFTLRGAETLELPPVI